MFVVSIRFMLISINKPLNLKIRLVFCNLLVTYEMMLLCLVAIAIFTFGNMGVEKFRSKMLVFYLDLLKPY